MSSYFSNSHTEKTAKYLKGIKRYNFISRFNDGLVVDGKSRIPLKASMQHALIVGGSGYGKTVSFVIPNLMKIRNASIYVLDPSQELYDLTNKYLSRHFDIYSINLNDVSKSNFWNPLDKVNTSDDVQVVADAIISSAYPNESGDAIFWNNGAKSIIATLLESVKNFPKEKTLFNVYNMLNRFNEADKKDLEAHLAKNLSEEAWLSYKGLVSQPEKVWGSMLATARVALSPIATDTLKKISSTSNIDFAEFRKKPSLVYVVVEEHRIKENMLFLSLLFREIFETMMEMPGKKDLVQYVLLDEAGNIFVPKLPSFITVLRKRKCVVALIIQSYRQLKSLYGDDAETVIENTFNHIYFPGLSLETCQNISRKIGDVSQAAKRTYFAKSVDIKESKSPLITPESIRTLKNGRALLLSGNLPAALLRMKPWFRNFWMKLKLKI